MSQKSHEIPLTYVAGSNNGEVEVHHEAFQISEDHLRIMGHNALENAADDIDKAA